MRNKRIVVPLSDNEGLITMRGLGAYTDTKKSSLIRFPKSFFRKHVKGKETFSFAFDYSDQQVILKLSEDYNSDGYNYRILDSDDYNRSYQVGHNAIFLLALMKKSATIHAQENGTMTLKMKFRIKEHEKGFLIK